jgi:hypothetical protein
MRDRAKLAHRDEAEWICFGRIFSPIDVPVDGSESGTIPQPGEHRVITVFTSEERILC